MTDILALFTPAGQHNHALIVAILIGAVAGGTSILYAALGETISERAGVVNVGMEGSMLVGCLAAFAATVKSGNPWVGVLAGAAAGGALAAVHAWMVVYRKANQLATGLVVLFLAIGVTDLYGTSYVSSEIHGFHNVAVPLLEQDSGARPDAVRPRPAGLRRLRGRARGVVVPLPQPLGPADQDGGGKTGVPGGLRSVAGSHPHRSRHRRWCPGRDRRGPALHRGGPVLGREHDRRPGLHRRGPGDLRRLGAVQGAGRGLPVRCRHHARVSQLQVHGVKVNQFLLDALPYLVTIIVLVALARKRKNAAPEALGQAL